MATPNLPLLVPPTPPIRNEDEGCRTTVGGFHGLTWRTGTWDFRGLSCLVCDGARPTPGPRRPDVSAEEVPKDTVNGSRWCAWF